MMPQLIAVLCLFYLIIYYYLVKIVPDDNVKGFITCAVMPVLFAVVWVVCSMYLDDASLAHTVLIVIANLTVIAVIILHKRGWFTT